MKNMAEWVLQVNACQPAVDFATQYSDNEQYYADLKEPTFFLWGLSSRQPELGLQVCCKVLAKAENVDLLTAPILALAVESSDEEVLQQQLMLVTKLAGQVRARRKQRHLDRAVLRLIRWKLGQVSDDDIADTAGAIGTYAIRHSQTHGTQGAAILMDWLREEVPYDIWKQGL